MRFSRRQAKNRKRTRAKGNRSTRSNRSNRSQAKKGGYTSYFPTKESELEFIVDFMNFMSSEGSVENKIARANRFFKSVLYFTHLLGNKRFVHVLIAKFQEFASHPHATPEFHENRLRALDFLQQYV